MEYRGGPPNVGKKADPLLPERTGPFLVIQSPCKLCMEKKKKKKKGRERQCGWCREEDLSH